MLTYADARPPARGLAPAPAAGARIRVAAGGAMTMHEGEPGAGAGAAGRSVIGRFPALARLPGRVSAAAGPAVGQSPRAVVLVEGMSDRFALEVIARRRGRDLAAEGVRVVAMGGAGNIGRFLTRYGPAGLGAGLAGLYDAGEENVFRLGLQRAGLGSGCSRAWMEALGFFMCVADLEDEFIRALGAGEVTRIIEAEGELRSLRILQRQPAQRERSEQDQLRRFMGTRSGRKHRYGRLLASAVDLNRVPRALDGVLARV